MRVGGQGQQRPRSQRLAGAVCCARGRALRVTRARGRRPARWGTAGSFARGQARASLREKCACSTTATCPCRDLGVGPRARCRTLGAPPVPPRVPPLGRRPPRNSLTCVRPRTGAPWEVTRSPWMLDPHALSRAGTCLHLGTHVHPPRAPVWPVLAALMGRRGGSRSGCLRSPDPPLLPLMKAQSTLPGTRTLFLEKQTIHLHFPQLGIGAWLRGFRLKTANCGPVGWCKWPGCSVRASSTQAAAPRTAGPPPAPPLGTDTTMQRFRLAPRWPQTGARLRAARTGCAQQHGAPGSGRRSAL